MPTSHEILGVSETATVEEIKKAFRALAKKCHPDRDKTPGANDRFRHIIKAYQNALSFVGQNEVKTKAAWQGSDRIIQLSVTVNDIISCAVKTVIINRHGLCKTCNGTGSKNGKIKKCIYCNGTGYRGINLVMGQKKKCLFCSGHGFFPEPPECMTCSGKGIITEAITKAIQLSPFSEMVVLNGEGDQIINGNPGNLIIEILVKNSSPYKLSGLDIVGDIEISPAQAVLGDIIRMQVFGRDITIKIPAGVQNEHSILQEGAGISYKGKTGSFKGTVRINIPVIISQEEEEIYKSLLKLERDLSWPKVLKS